jgi:autotransporter adhesin
MTGYTERRAQIEFRRGFVGSWVSGNADSRSLRRRLMAILRKAHQVLGVSRKGLGLGTLGAGGWLRSAGAIGGLVAIIALSLSAPAHAQYSAGGGTATGGSSVAVGPGSTATGLRGIALGNGATQSGIDSIAQGTSASAGSQNAIAIGFQSIASQLNSINIGARTVAGTGALGVGAIGLGTDVLAQARAVAIGINTRATGTFSTAVGDGAIASQNDAIAMGRLSVAGGEAAMAFGLSSSASQASAIAIGRESVAGGEAAIAFGLRSSASIINSIAIGNSASTTGTSSLSIGTLSSASGTASAAVGWSSVAGADSTAAFGRSANASGVQATALGFQTKAAGLSSVAVGDNANAGANYAVAMGLTANAVGVRNTALGAGARAEGANDSTAVGSTSRALGAGGSAFGFNSEASGANATALGSAAIAAGDVSTAVGRIANASAAGAAAIGYRSAASGVSSSALGQDANASGQQATAVGFQASASAASAVAMGDTANASAQNAIAMGTGATADAVDAVAIGTGARATGGKAVAIGADNVAYGDGAVAIGDPSYASGTGAFTGGANNIANADGTASATAANAAAGAVAIGNNNVAIGQGSVALGNFSRAGAAGAVAFGDGAIANNARDVALGSGSQTAVAVPTANVLINGTTYNFAGTTPTSTVSVGVLGAERTITNVAAGRIDGSSTDAINGSQLYATNQAVDSIGSTVNSITTGGGIKYFHANSVLADSVAAGTDSVAIGPNARSVNTGDVAIGANALSGPTTAVAGATIGGTAYTFAGANPVGGAFSIGTAGQERQIQNVAAGRLDGSSTDAVNGSQLFATNQQVTVNTTNIATLGTTISNIAGDISTAYTDANGDGIRYVRTNDRTLAVADSFAQGIGSTAVGYQATAVADGSLALGRDSQVTIVGGVALGAGSIADRALAPATGQIPAGPSNIIEYNTTDKTLLGAVSVGTATSYRQITNVADGTEAQDAVTIRQLQGAIASVAVTSTKYFHANSAGLDSLAVGAESVAVGPRTVVNGDNGIGIGNGAIVDQIAPGGTAIGQNAHVMLADGVALGTNATAGGIQSMALGAGATANHVNSVALGAGSATQATVATSSTTINGQTYNFAGAAPVGTVSVGDAGAERTITNVAAGRISADSTDAINGSQLYATNQVLEDLSDQIGDVGEVAENAVTYQTVTNPDGSVTRTNNVILQGGDPSAPVVISNVGAGVADTDAVNVAQLNDRVDYAIETANDYTDQVAETTLTEANNYTDQKFNQLNQEMGSIRSEARTAAAIGLAAASLRYDDRPGKLSVAVGGGYWRDETALAFGAGYTSENGRVRANLSGTVADGDVGVGAGLSFTLN